MQRQQQVKVAIAIMPKVQATVAMKVTVPKNNLLVTGEAKEALNAAVDAVGQAKSSVDLYKKEKIGRGSAGGKIQAAAKLEAGLASLHLRIKQFSAENAIYSKDDVEKLREQVAALKRDFKSEHKSAGKSKFKLATFFSKGTVHQDRVDSLLSILDKNLLQLESKLEDKASVESKIIFSRKFGAGA
jgi:CRISPR/Cas system type I-B associated protein Csh2 (Cas7 group RAMP superfamily)